MTSTTDRPTRHGIRASVRGRDLDAAGIADPVLRHSYEVCRQINAAHGRSYYLATLLLPPEKRPYVHALYGFARRADDIVDDVDPGRSNADRVADLRVWGEAIISDIRRGSSNDPVGRALIDTVQRWSIPVDHFESFLRSMAMDTEVCEYQTYSDLYEYMYGSAAVIGLQMVPILGPLSPEAYDRAADLGIAFQMTNFIRDIGEDLTRGRVYLPLAELAEHGVTRADLERRTVTPQLVDALRFQISRVRDIAARAKRGIDLLDPSSRDCVRAASGLYLGILEEVERNGYDVFSRRATVPTSRRLQAFLPAWVRANAVRRSAQARRD